MKFFTCDMILYRKMCDPSYNMQWYEIKCGDQTYCLVPVPVGQEKSKLVIVDELLFLLNPDPDKPLDVAVIPEVDWGPDVGNEVLAPWQERHLDEKGE